MNREDLEMLTNLETGEVSLVKRGANKKKRFPLVKKEDMMSDENEILEAVLKTEVEEEKLIDELFEKALSDKGKNAVKMALRTLSAFKDELPSDVLDKLAAAVGYPKPKSDYPSPKKAQMKEDEKEKEKEMKSVKKTELPPEVEEILKAREDENKELREQVNEFKKSLEDEKSQRELANWTAKAKEELSHYPGKSAEKLGEMLKSLNDVNPELAKEQFEQMKKASDMLKESELLKTSGMNIVGDSESSAIGQAQKMAEEVLQKSESLEMTREKALRRVFEMRPDLYARYLKENPAQTGRV